MCPIGSAPVVDGAPAVRRTQTASGTGAYPLIGPPITRFAWGAPRLSIQRMQSPTGMPVLVDRHGARPLAGAAHRLDLVRLDDPGRHRAAGRVGDELPPLGRVLHRAAAREQPGLDRAVVVPRDATGERHEPDLRPTRTQVDREDEPLLAIDGGAVREGFGQLFGRTVSWLSIMSAMTARMNSSASSVRPPATPP